MQSEYLMFVSQDNNNNKWYRMSEMDDGRFKAEWGRVGAAGQSTFYPMSRWDTQLREKLGKGYTKVVGHGSSAVVNKTTADSMDIKDPEVKALVSFLMNASQQAIATNYSVASGDVTKAQIAEAQELIGKLRDSLDSGRHTRDGLNSLLEKLYRTVPRKMADTRKFFLRDGYKETFVMELLQSEQALLNTLENQVQGDTQSQSLFSLDSLGLDIEAASQADRDLISKSTDFRVSHQKIFKVKNMATEARFKGGKTKLLYHGTKNANYMSVLQRGLMIKPNGIQTVGSMFGVGVYFSDKAQKSLGYTSLRGSYWASGSESKAYLAIFEVALGKTWNLLDGQTHQGWMTRLDQKQVSAKGFDSVFCKGGADLRNNEYVVYDTSRCTIRYLIEVNA